MREKKIDVLPHGSSFWGIETRNLHSSLRTTNLGFLFISQNKEIGTNLELEEQLLTDLAIEGLKRLDHFALFHCF